jgi:hypothetical protein
MIRLLSILIATVSIQSPGSIKDLGGNACKFNVSASQSQPKVVGPTDIVDRVVFLTQKDSPVEILVADFTGATLDIADAYFEFRDGHKFKIRNRGDRTVYRVDVMGYDRRANRRYRRWRGLGRRVTSGRDSGPARRRGPWRRGRP